MQNYKEKSQGTDGNVKVEWQYDLFLEWVGWVVVSERLGDWSREKRGLIWCGDIFALLCAN